VSILTILTILSGVLMVTGTVFLLASALGVLRFPDFYSRLHAAGKGDTLGQALVLVGLMILAGFTMVSLKLALIIVFIFVLNPTATHALARGAWLVGVRPWTGQRERPFPQREGQLDAAEREALLSGETASADSVTEEERDG